MPNTGLKNYSSNNKLSNRSSARVTRRQFEHQNKLRALYHDYDGAESPTKNSDPDPDPANEGEEAGGETISISSSQRVTRRRAKENVDYQIDSMTPVPLEEEDPEGEGGNSTEEEEETNDALKSAVTPSPKLDKDPGSPPLTKEEIKARAARRANYPLTGITEPGPNDCLFGRGGGTNHHPGNKKYRKMVEDKKGKYLQSKRLDKPLVAMEIITEWRAQDPPGRFLKQDEATKYWNDVGDKKAREKTSQALREKTPVKQREGYERTARFEPGTSSPVGRDVRKSSLARDHSLGTEIVGANEISLEGFSWEDSDKQAVRREGEEHGEHPRHHPDYPPHHYPPPHYGGHYDHHYPPPHHDYPPHPDHHHHPEHHPGHYPHVRQHSLSKNPLPDASTSHPAYPSFGEHPSSYYSHHHPGYGPPPPPPPGHHGSYHPPQPPPPSSYPHSPPQGHHYYEYPHGPPPPQGSRKHSLYANPLKGASTSQPARDFNEEESHASYDYDRPPPLPSPTYGGPPPPLPPPSPYYSSYGAPSPTQSGWPAPPHAIPPPQFTYQPGSNPSAFGRYEHGDRSNSIRSLGSSVDAYYDRDRRDSSSHSGSQSSENKAAVAKKPPPSEDPASAGTPQDYSKIAELIRDSSDNSSTIERATSYDEGARKSGYEDTIPRSQSMIESGSAKRDDGDAKPAASTSVGKPSLIRKLSGGAMARNASATPPNGILRPNPVVAPGVHRPEPVKRDTSNQPESHETKRSVKRVVLSRDQSAVSRRLKEEQGLAKPKLGSRVSSKMTRAEMLDRKLSVEMNKLGLDHADSDIPELDRMTTEDMLTSLIDDDELASPSPPTPLGVTGRVTTIDAIALDIANGKPESEWEDTLDLVIEEEIPGVSSNGSGVDQDIAEKWLKGET